MELLQDLFWWQYFLIGMGLVMPYCVLLKKYGSKKANNSKVKKVFQGSCFVVMIIGIVAVQGSWTWFLIQNYQVVLSVLAISTILLLLLGVRRDRQVVC